MAKIILAAALVSVNLVAFGQNIFPKKIGNCPTSSFCLDCGDTKADVDKEKFIALVNDLTSANRLRGIKGKVLFQILVDSTGKGCVLSHSDVSENQITKNIVEALNNFDGFKPAMTKDKIERVTSFNLSFAIENEKIKGVVERVDMTAFSKSFDRPQKPQIFNSNYTYKNEHLKDYQVTVWNSSNSNLPNNMNDKISVDQDGIVWLSVDQGLVKFNGKKFKREEQDITDKGKYIDYGAIVTDNANIKWVYAKGNIYSYDNKKWRIFDKKDVGADWKWFYTIVNNPKTSEVFFGTDNGLIVLKDGKWTSITMKNQPDLPSNLVMYAKRDSKNRLWIGTLGGTLMIDELGKTVNFELTETELKRKCILSMDEDEQGNLFFALFQLGQVKGEVNRDEGIAIRYTDGTMKRFTTKNSGMPFNNINCLLYDKNEKVLWMSTDRAGLIRYDLKDGWENYNSDNSAIPTSYISQIAFDGKGVLYLATRQGLVQVKRK